MKTLWAKLLKPEQARWRTGLVATLLGVTAVGGTLGLTRGQGGAAIAAMLRDPMSVLRDRSPGARPAGALTQTKQRLADNRSPRAVPPVVPKERVLSTVRERPVPAPAPVADEPYVPVAQPAEYASGSSVPIGGVVVPAVFTPGAVVGTVPTGPTGPVVTPTPTPTPEIPVVPAVPEPATWVSMMLGLGLIGRLMRRRGKAGSGPVASAKGVHSPS